MVITADGPIGAPADCTYLFAGYANVRTVDFGDSFVAHDVENMRAMFYGCSSLASLEVSAFDTSKLTNMEWIVCTCTSLKSLDLTKWDVGAVKESEGMFNGLTNSTETQRLREEVCTLIRHHMLPTRLLERSEPDRLAREVASVGELVPGFTWRELCLLRLTCASELPMTWKSAWSLSICAGSLLRRWGAWRGRSSSRTPTPVARTSWDGTCRPNTRSSTTRGER